MKTIKILLLLMLSPILLLAQYNAILPEHSIDKSQFLPPADTNYIPSRDAWDVVFSHSLPYWDSLNCTGPETDGEYYYVSSWRFQYINKFDMDGNHIETFFIPHVGYLRDLAYDGEYFYGCDDWKTQKLFKIDMENKVLIDTVPLGFSIRGLAYDDDLDVFYASNLMDSIKCIDRQGNVLYQFPRGSWDWLYGLAYDNWSKGGPYLWGFFQEGPGRAKLVQYQLPEGIETGFTYDVTVHLPGGDWSGAGGLFTHQPDDRDDIVIIGGIIQNHTLFGLELGPGNPAPQQCNPAIDLEAELKDSTDVFLNWSNPKYSVLKEDFESGTFPPQNWKANTQGWGWHNELPGFFDWNVPDWSSDYAVTASDPGNPDGCCDYLITPTFFLDSVHEYVLMFDSYFDGSNNQSAYLEYSLDDGQTWQVFHSMDADSVWKRIEIPLDTVTANFIISPVRFAFHADDNGDIGSGWAIDNVVIYNKDRNLEVWGYEVYRDGVISHFGMIPDNSFLDDEVPGGIHQYHLKTYFADCSTISDSILIEVPHNTPPFPCLPPENLAAAVVNNYDVELIWDSPFNSFDADALSPHIEINPQAGLVKSSRSGRAAWDVQFDFPLVATQGEAGAESDGNFIYTTRWNGARFFKYDLSGNMLDTILIPGVNSIRDMAYVPETGYMYATNVTSQLFILDMDNESLVGTLSIPDAARAIAYDHDLDAFYVNNWSSDIMLVDRQSGNLISSFPCGSYGNYYGFAYDGWSDDGPFLWGFSQDGQQYATLVQIQLPTGIETGFFYDLSYLSSSGSGAAGGLFTQEDLFAGTVTLGGVIQDELAFGLELGEAQMDYLLAGYNVYMDSTLHNEDLVEDNTYYIPGLDPGVYTFEVTAVYQDSLGNEICESEKEGPERVFIGLPGYILGGNVFAENQKLDIGHVDVFEFEYETIINEYSTNVDELGYYFLIDMYPSDYMIHAQPVSGSAYYDEFIPTYLGDVYHWELAEIKAFENNSYNNDIKLIKLQPCETGAGKINGNVIETSLYRGDPIEGSQVLLLNAEAQPIKIDYTDESGFFLFDNLAYDTYKVLVEIAGKSMEPVAVSLSETKPEETSMNLLVDDDHIYLGVNTVLPDGVEYMSNIYPNPASDIAAMSISVKENQSLNLKIYDIRGKLISTEQHNLAKGLNEISIGLQELEIGVYFIRFHFSSKINLSRKLLINK